MHEFASDMHIRPFERSDRDEVLLVALETGFFGESMSSLLDRPGLFVRSIDWFLSRYADHCVVVARHGRIVGYAVASSEDVRLAQIAAWIRNLITDLLLLPFVSRKDRRYILTRFGNALFALVGEEKRFRTPAGARLHINLRREARRGGIGSALLQRLFEDLREAGVKSVHANSYEGPRNSARAFWERNSFTQYSRVRSRSWDRWCPGEEIFLVCYVREL